MIRILTLSAAAAAALLIAAPSSAQSIVVPAAGKTTAQLHADISAAARKVCRMAIGEATFYQQELERCVKATVSDAVTKAGDPALAAAAKVELAQR